MCIYSLINLIDSLGNPEPNNIWFRNAFATEPVSALPILSASHEINHGAISWCTTTQLQPPMFSKHHDSVVVCARRSEIADHFRSLVPTRGRSLFMYINIYIYIIIYMNTFIYVYI